MSRRQYFPGRVYLVPTVELPVCGKQCPCVVLHQHVGDISGEDHQHIDLRFASDEVLYELLTVMGGDLVACKPSPVVMREMLCYRAHAPVINYNRPQRASFLALQRNSVGLVMRNMVCPHQGCDLSQAARIKKQGEEVVVCPCHGLQWSVESGRLVRRLPKKTPA